MGDPPQTFLEFFAGGGMARLGLGKKWTCLFANEFCEKKASAYRRNFGPARELLVEDVRALRTADIPGRATLAWASFPCQDLSLAGNGKGLKGERSGTFHSFWRLMDTLDTEGRGVPIVVLENVVGAITSNGGRDFGTILETLVASGYRVGPIVIDAARFVPQSRRRLFILAVKAELAVPRALFQEGPGASWHNDALISAHRRSPGGIRQAWIWWRLPEPPPMTKTLTELMDDEPEAVAWHSPEQTERLLAMMSETNIQKVNKARSYRKRIAGTIYKRIRVDEDGRRVQRAEVRFDQISGCLRTPVGGSSRQLIVVVEGESISSRLLSPREAARLMGVPDRYVLPEKYNDAYFLMGDGLAVPVVSWLEKHLISPLAHAASQTVEQFAHADREPGNLVGRKLPVLAEHDSFGA